MGNPPIYVIDFYYIPHFFKYSIEGRKKSMAYTITEFLNQNPGYARSYDEKTDTGYLKNLMSGKQISFKSGQGQQYGLGDFDQGAQSNTITDVNKLIGSLSGPTQTQFQGQNQQSVQNILGMLSGRAYTGFNYNPDTDQSLKQAQNQVARQTSEYNNARGLGVSSINTDNIAKNMASLVPQFREQAFQEYQAQNQQLANLANALQSMDDKQFSRYQQEWQNGFQERQLAYQQQQDKFTQDQQKISAAWNRVAQLGYADNEAAVILGIQPGTPSAQAREAAQRKTDEIEMYKMQLADKRQDEATAFERQKEVIGIEQTNRLASQAQEFQQQKELTGINAANQREMAGINFNNQKALAQFEAGLRQQPSSNINLKDYSDYIDNYFTTSNYNDDGKITGRSIDKQAVETYLTQLYQSGVDENIINQLAAKYGV
jgi:hypothetical protein